MEVKIIGVSQDFSLEDGDTLNFLKLRLSNNQEIRAAVDADTAQLILSLFIQKETGFVPTFSVDEQAPRPPQPRINQEYSEDGEAVIFGAQEPKFESQSVQKSHLDPEIQDVVQSIQKEAEVPKAPAKRKGITVQKDGYGYPVLKGSGTIDVDSITGGKSDQSDEDGVRGI